MTMYRLLVVLLVIGEAIPLRVQAQTSPSPTQPSAAQCEAMAKYRDTGLYAEWESVVGKSSKYSQAMKALDAAYADVNATKKDLNIADLAGALAHTAGTLSTLTLNLTGVRFRQFERGVLAALKGSKSAIDFYASSGNERIGMVGMYMAEAATSASALTRGAVAVKDLALDLKGMTDDLKESAAIKRQLNQQMTNVRRDAAQLQSKIDTIDALLAHLGGLKDAIDKACGNRGCPLPGADTASRKGAVVCLVSAQAKCPGCKGGWRHRCDATPLGLAWRPVDECLPNELTNAKSGLDRHKTASQLFAAQSTALTSSSTNRAEKHAASTSNAACGDFSPPMDDLVQRMQAASDRGGSGVTFPNARQSYDSLVTQCPSISECVRLGREQSRYNRSAAQNCDATPQHRAACDLLIASADANDRWADWLECRSKRG
jgi:hypothetical protein